MWILKGMRIDSVLISPRFKKILTHKLIIHTPLEKLYILEQKRPDTPSPNAVVKFTN